MKERTKKYIWGLFAGRCAICRDSLLYESEAGERSLVGEVAHIVGEKPGAPRGQSRMSLAQRNEPENLLLLCNRHHTIVDDNEVVWTVSKLEDVRSSHLDWLREQLAPALKWRLNMGPSLFLNIPRIEEYAVQNGYKMDLPKPSPGKSIHELGYELNKLTSSYEKTLHKVLLESVSPSEINYVHEGYVGQLIGFDRVRFRTKNLPSFRPKGDDPYQFTGDLARDPHIYHAFENWTLVMNIDPRWITTSTAFTLFRPSAGHSLFSGLARMTAVSFERSLIWASALVIGLPGRDVARGGTSKQSRVMLDDHNEFDLSHLEDDITKSRKGIWHGDITECDFCEESLTGAKYMIDGPVHTRGPWGCMCVDCYLQGKFPLGVGKGQLYRRDGTTWRLVGGYPEMPEKDDEAEYE